MLDSEGLKDRERGLASALCLCHLISSRRAFASRMIPFNRSNSSNVSSTVTFSQVPLVNDAAVPLRLCRKTLIPGLLVCGSGLQS